MPELGAVSEAEDKHEGIVDGTKLVRVETPGGAAEALRVDHRRLLDENPRLMALERDRWTEARRARTGRRRRDENRTEVEELVRLDDHRVPRPALLVAARASRRRQAEDLAADHLSRRAVERALQAAPG